MNMPQCPASNAPTNRALLCGALAFLAFTIPGALAPEGLQGQDRPQVVATLPTFASIAREVTGELADVRSIARGDEDPHFVNPRPSFARMIQDADLFISTGLDLEIWVPGLLDRANNPKVVEGAPGHVVAYSGIELLDIPASVSRTGGDVHVFGNPHIHTDPINAILIARNILAGLRRVDADRADQYERNERRFESRVMRRLFGNGLVGLLGEETLLDLARGNQFWSFVASQSYQEKPLTDFIGGWLAEGEPFRGHRMACYHKNWTYFSHRFQIECAMYVEPRPGIPPAPRHVQDVITFMREESIPVLFAANYFNRSHAEQVAERGLAVAVMVPEHVNGSAGVDDYFALVDRWVGDLAQAFRAVGVDDGP